MILLGLTGGIGSGKSTVSALLAERGAVIIDGQGLNMTVQSYCDNLDFGIVADSELVPDVWTFTDLLRQSMDELLAAVA